MSLTSPAGRAGEAVLEGLNDAQRAAVLHGEGPQLILAGAGTGKTAVITRRIAHLVATKACSAREILALTFTDKAAEEMETRVDQLVPYGFTDSTICTFHAFGDHLLREKGALLGLHPGYRLLSASDQLIFLREHVFQLPLDCLRPLANPIRHLQLLVSLISRAKDEDVSPEAYLRFCEAWEGRLDADPNSPDRAAWRKHAEVARVYARYQELLIEHGLLDFGDLITLALRLLREHPDVLAERRGSLRYLLVDEFQDTNAAQFELIRLLAGADGNLTVVGDDDQSIYKFRGAAVSNILQFTHYYPKARLQVLNDNYRSTQAILDHAYRLIRHNDPERLEVKHHLDKRLRAARGEGEPVVYRHFATVSQEADWVASEIERRHAAGDRPWSDFAILVRANRQAEPFLRSLNVKGIPARFSGARGLYQRPEIRLCTAWLRLLADPSATLPFQEVAASRVYDLPAADLTGLWARSRRRNLPMLETLRSALEDPEALSPDGRERGGRLLEDIRQYMEWAKRLPTGQIMYRFLTGSGLLAYYTEANTEEADLSIRNLARFFNLLQRYEHVANADRVSSFVQHLDLLEELGNEPEAVDDDPDGEAVHVLTAHRAKGLEFSVVYLVGLAANRFPPVHRASALEFPAELAQEILPGGDAALAEERRLFYVGMTRARDHLQLTSARDYGGTRLYKISRFVLEALDLPQDTIPKGSPSPLEQIRAHAPGDATAPRSRGPLPPGEPLSLSYYQIDDFLTCPLKYKYTHLLKIPVPPHHAILYGSALHNAVTEYYRRRMAGNSVTVDEVVDVFLGSWVNEGYISREHEEMRQQAGIQALKKFVQNENLSLNIPNYIEKSFSFHLGPNRIVGRMDRVDMLPDQTARIVDFKSSDVTEQKAADIKARDSLQLKIYAAAWRAIEGRLPSSVALHYLESGITGTWEPDPEKIDATETLINEVGDGIRRQEFTAKPDLWTCGYCAYKVICPDAAR